MAGCATGAQRAMIESARCLPPGVTEAMVNAPSIDGKTLTQEGNPLVVTIHELAGQTFGFIWFKGQIIAYDAAPADRTVPILVKDPEQNCSWSPFMTSGREI